MATIRDITYGKPVSRGVKVVYYAINIMNGDELINTIKCNNRRHYDDLLMMHKMTYGYNNVVSNAIGNAVIATVVIQKPDY